jgi:molybdopterin converting factor small subunit
MAVTVRIPAPLRPLVGGVAAIECQPGTVRQLIEEVDGRHAGFRDRVMQDGALRRFVNVFVGDEDVRFGEGVETPVADGQEVTILPAVAGGGGRP